ncbi:alcohol oxidase [Lentinula aciculospora]|uniref:Alcohol oxidase n=1 Tax=Lentinula aciculospora TaxID=153920 RepID=A0A9W9DXS7_9AGAR|nr:alcohol oxidase [Lentinula aciculospora]
MWPLSSYPEFSLKEVSDEYDYIIFGGGTAGAALANRLSAQEANKVLTRKILSVSQNSLGRSIELFTGSVLGETSRINQMLYEDIKPYFSKSERALYPCDADVHSTEARVVYSDLVHRVIEASEALGLPRIRDINSPVHPVVGCGLLHFTRDKNQHRSSTYTACLHIVTHTEAIKLSFKSESSLGKLTVDRVKLKSRNSTRERVVKARKEVILCGGPFGSPHLLMLSGIGPAPHLKEKDIPLVRDLPAVGFNLQDHFGVSVAFEVPTSHSLLSLQKRPWIFFIELFKYVLFGTGILLAPVLQIALFASSLLLNEEGSPTSTEVHGNVLPDIEIMPMAYDSTDDLETSRGMFSFLNVLLHPESKGTVRLSSADPSNPLVIDPQYLSNPADYAPLRASLKLTLRLRDRMIEQGYPLKDFGVPTGEDDASLDKFICKRNRTTYHYSSTCRMGPDNGEQDGGVVNEELFVHGFDNLRIADSSVFLWVPGTHLQAPSVALAEKCADMILSRHSEV